MSDTRDTGNALLDAAVAYAARGLALTWMDYGTKSPTRTGWNTPAQVITTVEGAHARFGNGHLLNIGLVHGLGTVKTCSFDVDEPEHTRAVFEELGLSFDAILESGAPCVRGKPGRVRFEYRQPPGMDLPARKLNWPAPDGSNNKLTVFELRAGPNQDVLPPSMHPDGQPYAWINPLPESNDDWPTPPPALLEIWQNWDAWEPLLQELCPWRRPAAPKPTPRPRGVKGLVDVIGQFNQAHSIRDILEAHGYRPKGRNRWLPPNSTSGIPSVRLLPGNDALVFSTNGSCPLNDDRAHDAFDCYRILAHGGDWKAARSEAAQLLGIELRPPRDRATGTGHSSEPPEREQPPLDAYGDDPEAKGQSRDNTAGPGPSGNRAKGKKETPPREKPVIYDGDALQVMEFQPLRWAAEGILPAGANLFAGLPKKGKSRLSLNIGFAISSGGYALGKIKVEQGEVLYIAIDDQKRRILEIVKNMAEVTTDGRIPKAFHLTFKFPRIGEGFEDELSDWLAHHPDARFVCVDIIKPIRPITTGKNPYLEDYAVGDALRAIAEEHRVAIMGNHHANKLAFAIEEGDDPMQAISGTSGLPGGFDNTMILYQRRGVATTFLHIEGNDTEAADLALEWDEQLLTWRIAGDAADFTGGPEWQRAKALFRQYGPLGVMDLAKLMNPDKNVIDDSPEHRRAKNLLLNAKRKGRVIVRRFDKRYHLPHEGEGE